LKVISSDLPPTGLVIHPGSEQELSAFFDINHYRLLNQ
jgi:hypothetical protein